jgi:serpin B
MKKSRSKLLIPLLIITLMVGMSIFPACQTNTASSTAVLTPVDKVTEAELKELVGGNNNFAFDLYQKLSDSLEGNFVYSPYSISTALAMTYAGARGTTAEQMAGVLHFSLSDASLPTAFRDLAKDMEARDDAEAKVQLDIANALWGQKGESFLSQYLKLIADYYGGGFDSLDFRNTRDACAKINDWFSDNTNNHINDLLKPSDLTAAVLVITNALYFKGEWASIFRDDTKNDVFYLLDGTTVQVPMMKHDVFNFEYTDDENYQAITLQYTKFARNDNGFSMTIIMPDAGQFNTFERSLSSQKLNAILGGMNPAGVILSMPRFKFDSSYTLNQILQELGMVDAFNDADFSGINGARDLFISHVGHGATISVDEKGTEAAAGTAVVMTKAGGIQMVVNRPFIFLIRDNKTGTILFIGRVLNPGA